MLQTNLKHIESEEDFRKALEKFPKLMVCCGRMGPMCIPVFKAMEIIQTDYPDVAFRDMFFDSSVANRIKSLPEVKNFMGLPFTIYFKDGKVVRATSSVQTIEQIKKILNEVF